MQDGTRQPGILLIRRGLAATIAAAAALGIRPAAAQAALAGTIRFAWWGGPPRHKRTNAICDLFEQKHPGTKITREIADWQGYWDKLAVQSAGRDVPQALILQSRYLDQYGRSGGLRPLDDLVASGQLSLQGIAPSVVATGRIGDGKLYSIPFSIFNISTMYNRTLMERAGVAPPAFEWTWDDFITTAKAASKKLPRGVAATSLLGGEAEPFYPFVIGRGEQVFTDRGVGFSKATMIEWFRIWEDLRKSGATVTPEVMAEDRRSSIEDAPLALGRVMMDFKGANQLDSHQAVLSKAASGQQLDIQKQPNGPKGAGDMVGTNGMSIGANTSPQDLALAAAFCDFFVQDDQAAMMYASDLGTTSVDRQQDQQYAAPGATFGTKRQIELLKRVLPLARPEVYPSYYQAMLALQTRTYQSVAFETNSIEAAVDAFFTEAEGIVRH